jgi:hypothetical protein
VCVSPADHRLRTSINITSFYHSLVASLDEKDISFCSFVFFTSSLHLLLHLFHLIDWPKLAELFFPLYPTKVILLGVLSLLYIIRFFYHTIRSNYFQVLYVLFASHPSSIIIKELQQQTARETNEHFSTLYFLVGVSWYSIAIAIAIAIATTTNPRTNLPIL